MLALIVWVLNPFAALLLVPALHMWLWLAQPGARGRRWSMALLLLVGILPLALILFYYANAYGLSPIALAWGLALLPGGAMPIVSALCWSLALGCGVSAVVIGLRAARGRGHRGRRHRSPGTRSCQLRRAGFAGWHGVGAAPMSPAITRKSGVRSPHVPEQRPFLAGQPGPLIDPVHGPFVDPGARM